ncbi:Tigger transposable element-derived protein 7-like 44, partial [Homarus americanus]
VSDIQKAKGALQSFAMKCSPDSSTSMMTVGDHKLIRQRSFGVAVRGVEMQMATEKLATHLGISNFHVPDEEAASAPTEEIRPFPKKLTELIAREGLFLSQVYNTDKTGLFCRSLPENIQTMAKELSTKDILKKDLEEVMAVLEDEVHKDVDTRGQRTLQNLRNYDIKAAIFNWAAAWKDVKVLTLANGWKKLLQDVDLADDFEGFEVADYDRNLKKAGEDSITKEFFWEWLNSDKAPKEDDDDDEDEDITLFAPKLSAVRAGLDSAVEYLPANTNDPDLQNYYSHLHELRDLICRKQLETNKQTKIDSFFRPKTRQSQQDSPFVYTHTVAAIVRHYSTRAV